VSTTCSEGALGLLADGTTQSESDDSDSEKDSGIFSHGLQIPRCLCYKRNFFVTDDAAKELECLPGEY